MTSTLLTPAAVQPASGMAGGGNGGASVCGYPGATALVKLKLLVTVTLGDSAGLSPLALTVTVGVPEKPTLPLPVVQLVLKPLCGSRRRTMLSPVPKLSGT